jgi:hypothetical protein
MTDDERESVIKECIEYMRARPGRRGVTILEAMLKAEKAKYVKPAENHPWRATVKEVNNGQRKEG